MAQVAAESAACGHAEKPVAKILLGVTGSVAAQRTPVLVSALEARQHSVKVLATTAALYFFSPQDLPPGVLFTDDDEWPRRRTGGLYQRDDPVLHIELRRWADVLLIAPLDANTLAKLAVGLCDNSLTCVWRAWDPTRLRVLAPAMNTLMWEHRLTAWHLRQLADQEGVTVPPNAEAEAIMSTIHAQTYTLRFIPPISKRLACGDVGIGAMAEVADIVAAVEECLNGNRLLLTSSGPKPTS